jgi:TRAP-type C4-dicarboxylate transport system permease small subunit
MDALYVRFSPAARRVVDALIAIMGIVVCGFLTWVSTDTTLREYEFNTLLSSGEIPQWPQTFAIPFSFGLMTLVYLGVLLGAVTGRTPVSAPPTNEQA